MGIGFREPFDIILRRLDQSYVDEAWATVARSLPEFGLAPGACRWGTCHPGILSTVDGSPREDSAAAGVGWVLTESDAGLLLDSSAEIVPRWRRVDTALARGDPPLVLLYDHYRAQYATRPGGEPIEPSDTVTGLDYLLAVMADDVTDWRGRSTQGEVPWMRVANAIAAFDSAALAGAVTDVHRSYTPAGVELCLEGFSAFLLQWVKGQWSPLD